MSTSLPSPGPGFEAPFDPAVLARMASAMFAALPGNAAPGVQAPVNIAPPGSPLASPGGFGPGVPGTPVPQGLVPGANLLPASPTPLASLAHRAPALLPHATAANGLPDNVVSTVPAYEPRFGSGVLGVPDPLDALAAEPFAQAEPPRAAAPAGTGVPQTVPSAEPKFYFVDAVVLPSGYVTPAKPAPHGTAPPAGKDRHPAFDVHAVRRDFPVLQERVNGRQLVWFDNAATTHKPRAVIDRISYFYEHENSNIHRAAHELAARATDAYEGARERARAFINAPEVEEVIFVRGTTEAINLVAKSWGWQHVGEGDEIVVSHLEHHANIVPWQQLAAARGAKLRVIPVDDSGQVLLDEYQKLLSDRTKIVAVTQVSNALGTVVPVKQIVELAHRAGARALVDGAQSVSHMRVDVQDIGADFFVFSGHKVFGPTGIGVLWGRRDVLEDMPPWQGGGNMIADVTFEKTVFQPIPNKFEAGTGNIADAVGLGAAIDYVNRIGIENIARYEHALLCHGMQALAAIPGVRLVGTAADKASVMSFVLAGYSTEEVGQALNEEGIAVRTGHHCAQPILRRFGLETTVRPSLAFYNTFDEIDRLVAVVRGLAGKRRAG
ncbi:family 2A encapsulin nanocompartment cargo protein cysteine desulfurase [Variovorax sp. JS1663]|uniref:family 2A encapsulin nanocompartment cargo protein cysteine desulfurase n=1 Tax=Variovorax sp. JS1663 TaxID=1851577 RepID=UPI000B342AEF|nr:family 2A encapsulin nanocompartment cargo protein cysteine desulfurase [Variovorax sp. JS1663]OUM03904.1 cysteine desulfurase [Variovorax sp. JS1663]